MKYYINGVETTESKLMDLFNKSEQHGRDFYRVGDEWFSLIVIDDRIFDGTISNVKSWNGKRLTKEEIEKEFTNHSKT